MIGMAVAATREIPPWIIAMILRVCCLVSAREKRTAGLLAVARTTHRGLRLLHSASIQKPIGLSHAHIVPKSRPVTQRYCRTWRALGMMLPMRSVAVV
jgi:hypothetical protein